MGRTPLFQKLISLIQYINQNNSQLEPKLSSIYRKKIGLSRRRFIRSASLATGSAIALAQLSQAKEVDNGNGQNHLKIAIIGGGIAGLNAAYQLKKVGLKAMVYEAKNRLGGRIYSKSQGVNPGLVLDLGGHFINSEHEDMLALVKEFSLELFNRYEHAAQFSFPKVVYYFEGKQRSEQELAEKLRPLALQIMSDANLLDNDYDRFAAIFDQISVTEYLDQHQDKITDSFIRILLENSIRTEFGVEPENSSALQLLFNLPTVTGDRVEVLGASDEAWVVKGGSGLIIDNLANALSGQIQTRMRLTKIQTDEKGYRLTFANNESLQADYVILAIPFTVLRNLDIRVDLPSTLQRFINEVNLGHNEKFFVGFNHQVWRQPQGFVQEAWTDLGFSAVWEATQRQTEKQEAALTFFLGASEVQNIETGKTKKRGEELLIQLEKMIPQTQQAASGQFLRTRWSLDPLIKGGYTSFQPRQLTEFADFFYIEADTPEERQDVRVGNLIFAGEHLSDEFYGYMNGAAQTGRLAAESIIESLVS